MCRSSKLSLSLSLFLSKREISRKDVILAGEFSINLLDFDANKRVQNFVFLMFRFGMILTINKPTRDRLPAGLIISSQTL